VLYRTGEQPGEHKLDGTGRQHSGRLRPRPWKHARAVDDPRAVQATAEREFALDNPIGSIQNLAAVAPACAPKARGVVAATFALGTRPRVTVKVEKPSGIVIATSRDQLNPAPQKVPGTGRRDRPFRAKRRLQMPRRRENRSAQWSLYAGARRTARTLSGMLRQGISSSFTSPVAPRHLAVFLLMAIDAVFPAASEIVIALGGAVAPESFPAAHMYTSSGAKIGLRHGELGRDSPGPAPAALRRPSRAGQFGRSAAGVIERHGRWSHSNSAKPIVRRAGSKQLETRRLGA